MALRDVLRAFLRERDAVVAELTAEAQTALMRRVLGDEFVAELAQILGEQPTAKVLEGLLAALEGQVENITTTAALDAWQDASNAQAEASGVDRFVYLGPDDAVTRPFCDALVGTWLTKAEILELDNGQTGQGSAYVQRGGYNCRHSFLALPDDQSDEFPHGDVAKANAAAALGRAA